MYIELKDDATSPVEVNGTVRLVQKDADRLNTKVVYSNKESVLHGSKTDINQKVPLPQQVAYPWVGEDSYLAVEFDPNSDTDSISKDNSTVQIPVTKGNVAQ